MIITYHNINTLLLCVYKCVYRLCLQTNTTNVKSPDIYNGMVDGLVKIYKAEGVRGLYKVNICHCCLYF